ncbi:hypothetical protein AN642_01220 [Epulopiscium sp. SCG-B10WGA-EpuloA2]|nr:hypothetical protein AN642_01220 [Epulopiscium sp. SCG-B10WGA-EpuloA2]
MKSIELGKWVINFNKDYRVVKDDNTLIAIDNEREVVSVLSINDSGNICIEKNYYSMVYEILDDKNVLNCITVKN